MTLRIYWHDNRLVLGHWARAVLFVLFIGSAQVMGTDDQRGAILTYDSAMHDFGRQPTGHVVRHTFVLKSTGNEPVQISQVIPACGGCTKVRLSTPSIQPGTTAELEVELDLAGLQGKVSKSILVQSNDPKKPAIALEICGIATLPFEMMPQSISFDVPDAGPIETKDVTIRSLSGTFNVTDIKCDSPHFTATFEPSTDRMTCRVTVKPRPSVPRQRVKAHLHVQTDRKDCPVLLIPVDAMRGELTVRPDRILIDASQIKPKSRYILIGAGGAKSFRILGVTTPSPTIESSISRLPSGEYVVRISNLESEASLDGKQIIIRTDVPSISEIAIPIEISPALEIDSGRP